jgi:hypothetical protein
MSRFRVLLACGALISCTMITPVVLPAGVAWAVPPLPPVSVTTACAGSLSGSTYTLTANCATTVSLTVPAGDTLDGAGHTISASDPGPLVNFQGGVLANAGATMNVEDVTLTGDFPYPTCRNIELGIWGIWFNDASGSVSNVTITGMTRETGCAAVDGSAIRASSTGPVEDISVTKATMSDYQRSAVKGTGPVKLDVTDSTLGPPDAGTSKLISQNGVSLSAGATGSFSYSTVYGSGFGSAAGVSTAILGFGTEGLTIISNTLTGAGTDIGIALSGSSGTLIENNAIGRTSPDSPDSFGVGVSNGGSLGTNLVCNTFSGWKTDIDGATQGPCITTTTLPDGTVAVPYSVTLTATGGTAPHTWSLVSGSLPPGLALAADGAVRGTPTKAGIYDFTVKVTDAKGQHATLPLTIVISSPPPPPKTQGYWLTAGDGGVFTFGSAAFRGSAADVPLVAPVVGIATTPDGVGYWLTAKDGGVFSYGVPFHGSLGNVHLAAPIVAIAATPDGAGYYLVGADGGVFTFGDARFQGSLGNVHLAAPIAGIAVTRDGGGYYLVGKDGGVFSFGDARFQGSLGATPLNTSIAGIAVDNATQGYWLVGANGSLYNFGAPPLGSVVNVALHAPVVGIAATQDGLGYRFVGSDGGVFCFGDADFLGSLGNVALHAPAVGMTPIS